MKLKLTDTFIRAKKPGAVREEFWDTDQTGLLLRSSKAGLGWFVRTTTNDGKKTRLKLGDWPALGLSKARHLAAEKRVAIRNGADPVAEKHAQRAARRAAQTALTVRQSLDQWQQSKATAVEKPWSATYASRVASALRVHVPEALMRTPVRRRML